MEYVKTLHGVYKIEDMIELDSIKMYMEPAINHHHLQFIERCVVSMAQVRLPQFRQ